MGELKEPINWLLAFLVFLVIGASGVWIWWVAGGL